MFYFYNRIYFSKFFYVNFVSLDFLWFIFFGKLYLYIVLIIMIFIKKEILFFYVIFCGLDKV